MLRVYLVLLLQISVINTCKAVNCQVCQTSDSTLCQTCSTGYYMSTTNQCSKCTGSCKECSTNPTNCTACVDPTYQQPPNCACTSKQMDDLLYTCLDCYHSCATCNGFNTCVTCSSGYYEYSQPVKTCRVCQGPCKTCVDSATNCTSCWDPNNQKPAPSCACKSTDRYLVYSFCYLCISPCATCTTSSACLSCVNTYILEGDKCIACAKPCKNCQGSTTNCLDCIDINQTGSSLMNITTKLCDACTFPCVTCQNTVTTCLSCAPTYTYDSISQTCDCLSTQFEQYGNPKTCQNCMSPCSACKTSNNFCTSCITGLHRHLQISPNQCICDNGYYNDGTSCQPCVSPCFYCSSATHCVCQIQFYTDQNSNCQPCTSPCFDCITNATNCISCISTYYFNGSQCNSCQLPCLNCIDTDTKCTSCAQINQILSNDTCICPDGYFMNSSFICQLCIHSCSNCIDNQNKCLSCAATFTLSTTISNQCICIDGYYEELNDNPSNCKECSQSCQTCKNDPNYCTSCIDANQIINASNQCICKEGYIYNGLQCEHCLNPCTQCQGSTSFCTSCKDIHHFIISGLCLCENGWVNDLNYVCQKCTIPCQSCSTTTSHCDSCTDINHVIDAFSQCKCSDQFYSDTISSCKACTKPCDTCDINGCLTCIDPNQMIDSNLNCICKDGYFLNNINCTKCLLPCANCIAQNQCTSCFDPQQTLINDQCICPDGFYFNNTVCSICQINCSKCLAFDHCTDCKTGYYLYNDLCDNYCLDPCQACTIPIYCTSCIEGYYQDSEGICLKCENNCKMCNEKQICEYCNDGYLQQNYICIKCNKNCLTCIDSIDNCLSCKPNEELIEKKCYCDSKTIKTVTDTCIKCEYPCLACSNQGICLQCASINGLYLNSDSECVCENDYEFYDYICNKKCPQFCLLCHDGICYECQDKFDLNNNQCIQIQPCGNGQFDEQEECDDGNLNSNDGCNKCKIEDGWNCNQQTPSLCTYYESPSMILTYLNQTSSIQYVQLEFSEEVKVNSNRNLSETINIIVLSISLETQNITLYPIKEATSDLSFAKYQIAVEIYEQLLEKPKLSIKLNQEVFNQYEIPIERTQTELMINIPKYLSSEQKQKAKSLSDTNQNVIYGLGAISALSLFMGEAAVFQEILKLLQYQSYLKYINLDYPENLLIFFKSTNIVSVSAIVKYTNLNYYLNKYSLKQGPLNTDGKFAFYQYDADLITNLSCQFIQFVGLVSIAVITQTLEKIFYNRKNISCYITCLNNTKKDKTSKIVFPLQKTLYSMIKSVFTVAKQFSKQGLRSLFLINSQDLLFKAFIYLHYMQFDSIRNYIQAALATIIIFAYLLLIFFTLQSNNFLFSVKKGEQTQIKYEVITLARQTAFLFFLVIVQGNQILQTVFISLINFSYFVTVKRKKTMQKQFNFIQQIIEVMVLLFTLSSFLYFDDLSKYFSEEVKIQIAWTQIALLLLSLLAEAFKFLIAKSQSLIKYIKDKIRESELKKKIDPLKQFYLIEM